MTTIDDRAVDQRVGYARVDRVIDHDADRVWAVAGTFGGIDAWVDGVTSCVLEGEGVGAVRNVTRGGNIIRERLDHRDEAGRSLTYTILDPSPMPASNVMSVLTVEAAGEGRTRIVWASSAAELGVPAEILGRRIERFYSDSIDGLDRLLGA